MIVQPVADRVDDRGADAQDSPLAQRPHPQKAVIHQELDAVFLRLDRVFLSLLDQLEVADADLKTARRAGRAVVCADGASHHNRRFLRQLGEDGKSTRLNSSHVKSAYA